MTSTLSPPREEYNLREVNALHKAALKQGLIEVPLACSKPLIVVAEGLMDATQIKTTTDLAKFKLEVLGGNHRREALMEILEDEEKKSLDCYKYVHVHVYSGKSISPLKLYLNIMSFSGYIRNATSVYLIVGS